MLKGIRKGTASVLAVILSLSPCLSGAHAEGTITSTSEPNVTARYYEAYDITSGQEILGKRETEKMYPASITKVLFSEVMLDHLSELGKKTDDIAGKVLSADNEKAARNGLYRSGLKAGETVSYEDLLHSIIYMSGAEACYAAVRLTFGTEAKAAESMNEKAKKLGMTNSHFVNVTGAHSKNHYTTCSDFVKVMQAAWNSPELKQIFSTGSYTTSDRKHTFKSPTSRASSICRGLLIGGKTGTTDAAQHTFAGYAKLKGHDAIIITGLSPLKISHSNLKDASAVSKFITDNYELKNVPSQIKTNGYIYTPRSDTQLIMKKAEATAEVINDSIVIKSGDQQITLAANKTPIKTDNSQSSSTTKKKTKKKTEEKKVTLMFIVKCIRKFLVHIFGGGN